MRSITKKYLIPIAAVLAVIFLLQKIHWLPSLSNPFKSKPLLIDETPVLVKEIHNLSQLITISMYDEVVMAFSKPKHLPSFPGLRPVPDKIVLIGKGTVLAGVDLLKMKQNNLTFVGDSVSLYLPPAQILSTIVNPSGFETFAETGNWAPAQVTEIKKKIRSKITARALQNQILPRAYQRCRFILENFFRSLGFRKVNFRA